MFTYEEASPTKVNLLMGIEGFVSLSCLLVGLLITWSFSIFLDTRKPQANIVKAEYILGKDKKYFAILAIKWCEKHPRKY